MSNKFFGQFLLQKNLINKAQLLTTIDIQRASNKTLGALAIEQGYLTEEKADRVNAEQQRVDGRFGEVAISQGLMTTEQVDELFDVQKSERKFFGEILVEQKFLTRSLLEQELSLHSKEKEVAVKEMDYSIENHEHSKLLSSSLDIAAKMFSRVPKIQVQLSGVLEQAPVLQEGQFVWTQAMYLEEGVVELGWVMNNELASEVSIGFMGVDMTELEDVRNDSVSEFMNIVLGHIASYLTGSENESKLDPSVVTPSLEFSVEDKTGFYMDMSSTQEDFTLFFLFS